MNKPAVVCVVLLGIILLFMAIIYFVEPAKSLPGFFPGHDTSLSRHHYTHGIAALFLGLGAFIMAWFLSGKKSSKQNE